MKRPEIIAFGNTFNLKVIRDCILDHSITDKDTLLLRPTDFDDLILEYRALYNSSMEIPFYFLGVLVEEDKNRAVPIGRIGVVRNDLRTRENQGIYSNSNDDYEAGNIFRCGWCGNFVDYDGLEFEPETRLRKIRIYEKYNSLAIRVNGECCRNRQTG
jgi:hypothetical protein